MEEIESLLEPIKKIHRQLSRLIVNTCSKSPVDQLAQVSQDLEHDTQYEIDTAVDAYLLKAFEQEIASLFPVVLISEGMAEDRLVLPRDCSEADAVFRIIVDPIDGSRGLMFQKRSAWILTGIAANKGENTNLRDIELAVQTEIPLVKQHLFDSVWCVRGKGVHAERENRLTGERSSLTLAPSGESSIEGGFASLAGFFPGNLAEIAAINDELVIHVLGPVLQGKAYCFEDQYISTGGQLYEMMAGHDRFIADLRPLLDRVLRKSGQAFGLCAHPYDLATELIARELGVIVTDPMGAPLSVPMGLTEEVAWVAYANESIRRQVEPVLQAILRKRGFI